MSRSNHDMDIYIQAARRGYPIKREAVFRQQKQKKKEYYGLHRPIDYTPENEQSAAELSRSVTGLKETSKGCFPATNPIPRSRRLDLVAFAYGQHYEEALHKTKKKKQTSKVMDTQVFSEEQNEEEELLPLQFSSSSIPLGSPSDFASTDSEEELVSQQPSTSSISLFSPSDFFSTDSEESSNEQSFQSDDLQQGGVSQTLDVSQTMIPIPKPQSQDIDDEIELEHMGQGVPATNEENIFAEDSIDTTYLKEAIQAYFAPEARFDNPVIGKPLPRQEDETVLQRYFEMVTHDPLTPEQKAGLGVKVLPPVASIVSPTVSTAVKLGALTAQSAMVAKQSDALFHARWNPRPTKITEREKQMLGRVSEASNSKQKQLIVEVAINATALIAKTILPPSLVVKGGISLLSMITSKVADYFIGKSEEENVLSEFFHMDYVQRLLDQTIHDWIEETTHMIQSLEGRETIYLNAKHPIYASLTPKEFEVTKKWWNPNSTRSENLESLKKGRAEIDRILAKYNMRENPKNHAAYMNVMKKASGELGIHYKSEIAYAKDHLKKLKEFQTWKWKDTARVLAQRSSLGDTDKEFSANLLTWSIAQLLESVKKELASGSGSVYTELFLGLGYQKSDIPNLTPQELKRALQR